MIEIREARETDRESAIRVLWKAFEATSSFEDIMKEDWIKRWNNPEKEDWAYVAMDNGKVVANLSFFATQEHQQVIRKRPVRFAGLWAVATDPAYRRKGLIRKLFDASFPRMREKEAYLSILDPFYRPFYEKFGYAIAEKRMKHVLKRDQIRVSPTNKDISVREASPQDTPLLREIERTMVRFGSRFFTDDQSWDQIFKNWHVHILEDSSVPVGSVCFRFSRADSGYKITAGLTRYKRDDVFPSIVELVRNYATNASELTWYTDVDAPVRHFFSDVYATQSYLIGSMMMRVVDLEGYCRSIAVPEVADESVVIKLNDEQCPWNTGTYRLVPSGGSLEAQRGDAEPDVVLSPFQLSEVISGITPPVMLRAIGEVKCEEETARKLEAIFSQDTFVSYVRF